MKNTIDNSRLLECVCDITSMITKDKFGDRATIEIQDGLSDSTCIAWTVDAQDFYNDMFDEIEGMIINNLKLKIKQ
tara:strand:- start:786 stop:1013 length:228 start_codon:yes stop_codon:yes gene_type:complete